MYVPVWQSFLFCLRVEHVYCPVSGIPLGKSLQNRKWKTSTSSPSIGLLIYIYTSEHIAGKLNIVNDYQIVNFMNFSAFMLARVWPYCSYSKSALNVMHEQLYLWVYFQLFNYLPCDYTGRGSSCSPEKEETEQSYD